MRELYIHVLVAGRPIITYLPTIITPCAFSFQWKMADPQAVIIQIRAVAETDQSQCFFHRTYITCKTKFIKSNNKCRSVGGSRSMALC